MLHQPDEFLRVYANDFCYSTWCAILLHDKRLNLDDKDFVINRNNICNTRTLAVIIEPLFDLVKFCRQ